MPLSKSQTLPPVLPSEVDTSPPAVAIPPAKDTLSALRPIQTSALPSPSTPSPNKHAPPRPSPLARASTILVSHLPPNLQNLHFELPPALANFELPTLEGLLARFVPQAEEDIDPVIPDIIAENYEPLGTWKLVFGFNCYVIGPDPSINCLVGVYDLFGYSLPTIQGADVLHKLTGATVYLPDFFRGKPFPSTSFPPKTSEQHLALQEFFLTNANIDDRRDELVEFGSALRDRFKGQPWAESTKVAAYGVSWGGKLTYLAGSQSHPFYAVVCITPAMLSLPDAEGLKVPVGLFPSRDEPVDTIAQMVETFRRKTFSAKCVCKPFPDMPHGFASARSQLSTSPLTRERFSSLHVSVSHFLRAASRSESLPPIKTTVAQDSSASIPPQLPPSKGGVGPGLVATDGKPGVSAGMEQTEHEEGGVVMDVMEREGREKPDQRERERVEKERLEKEKGGKKRGSGFLGFGRKKGKEGPKGVV